MAFEADLIAAGAVKIVKRRFFAVENLETNQFEVDEVPQVDCNGDPIHPHVWVPPGKELRYYSEDTRSEIDRKIALKEAPQVITKDSAIAIKEITK